MSGVPQTYVMVRLDRWVIYCIWKADLLVKDPTPDRARSWWWRLVTNRHMHDPGAGHARERPCPVDVIEAEETDRCVMALPAGLRRMVASAYLDPRPVRVKVAELGLGKMTYYRWLGRAYNELLGLFNDVAAGISVPEKVDQKAA